MTGSAACRRSRCGSGSNSPIRVDYLSRNGTLCDRWWSQWAWLLARRRWRLPGRHTNSPAYGWRITSFVPRLVVPVLSCREGLLWSLKIRCLRYWTAQQCCGSGLFFMQVRFVKLMRIRILLLNFQTKCSNTAKSRPATLWINACIRTLFCHRAVGCLTVINPVRETHICRRIHVGCWLRSVVSTGWPCPTTGWVSSTPSPYWTGWMFPPRLSDQESGSFCPQKENISFTSLKA